MDFNVNIGSSEVLTLERAILIYGSRSNQGSFATVHAVKSNDADAQPQLGPGQLLTVDFIRDLIKSLSEEQKIEVFPETLLCRTELVTAWWAPPRTRMMFFHKESTLAEISGQKCVQPGLVFRVIGGSLAVVALASDERPTAKTRLCNAPYWNVYADGRVCHGTMRVPKTTTLDAMNAWEKAFFGSNFTHGVHGVSCKHPGGIEGLWREIATTQPSTFPCQHLRPHGKTLEEFLNKCT